MTIWRAARRELAGAWRSLRYDLSRPSIGGEDDTADTLRLTRGDQEYPEYDSFSRRPRPVRSAVTVAVLVVVGSVASFSALVAGVSAPRQWPDGTDPRPASGAPRPDADPAAVRLPPTSGPVPVAVPPSPKPADLRFEVGPVPSPVPLPHPPAGPPSTPPPPSPAPTATPTASPAPTRSPSSGPAATPSGEPSSEPSGQPPSTGEPGSSRADPVAEPTGHR